MSSIEQAQQDKEFQFFLAKLFGHRAQATDGDKTCVGYFWRGGMYITDFL